LKNKAEIGPGGFLCVHIDLKRSAFSDWAWQFLNLNKTN